MGLVTLGGSITNSAVEGSRMAVALDTHPLGMSVGWLEGFDERVASFVIGGDSL